MLAQSETAELVASPWHDGERALQHAAGVAASLDLIGRRTIRDHLIDQHRKFYAALPVIVAGTVDERGDAWATLIAGTPGFLHAPDATTLAIEAPRDALDPADGGMAQGDAIGLLGIDLGTRRRNRLNGRIRRTGAARFDVAVEQSFGNCPQYIQRRDWIFVRDPNHRVPRTVQMRHGLDDAARSMIAASDTFFVATYCDWSHGTRQVDVSHRGGRRGFVRVEDNGALIIPDYAGNQHFATLGNILENPQTGLAFADFATGDLLQLSGSAVILPDRPDPRRFPGAERLWRFWPQRLVRRTDALPLRWSFDEATAWSPALPV